MAQIGPFEIVYDGRGGVPGCTWKIRNVAQTTFTLYDLADRLRTRGWQVPAYPLPVRCGHVIVQLVVARLGLSLDLAALLVEDIKRAIQQLVENPSLNSLTRQHAEGFNHS